MWIILSKVINHGKETHFALESQIWCYLSGSLVSTSQRLDGEDKDNQRTQYLLVITTQEQKVLKRFLDNNFENKFSALEITKESFFDD